MDNPYKSIGNTAAAVVSLLAIGTLCWWQRTPGPINAPRPQDEAEIMTAVLERHYAMGRTNVGFFRSVFNGRTQTNVTEYTFVNSVEFSNGASSPTNHYFLGDTNTACYYDFPPSGAYTVTMYRTSGTLSQGTLHSGGSIIADTSATGYLLSGGPDCADILWYSDGLGTEFLPYQEGVLDDPAVWGSYDYTYSTTNLSVTNIVKLYDADTNTIGFFPKAPAAFPQGVRTAFVNGGFTSTNYHGLRPYYDEGAYQMGGFVDWWAYGSVNLYLPPMDQYSADKSSDPLKFAAPWCDAGWNTFTGWIVPENAFMDSGDLTWFGSVIHSHVFTAPLEMWLGWGEDVIYWTRDDFANQIAPRALYVWTNYVTLPASALTTTTNYQYEVVTNRVVGDVTNTITNILHTTTSYVNTASVNTFIQPTSMRFAFERDAKYDMWSTNVYRDMGRALSLLQWIRDLAQPRTNTVYDITYTNGVLASSSSATYYSVADPYLVTSLTIDSGVTNSRAYGVTVNYAFANNMPFGVGHVLFQPLAIYSTNCPSAWSTGPAKIDAVPTNTIRSSGWWPEDPGAFETIIDDFARTNNGSTNMFFSMQIPYDCYHVQFTALTNYLDHAPAR
jgi:hypothetical protein